jgi:Rps23 Pro-64 3,4-dihydroxylase Tpa1-like proline 4-hydroxylase
MFNETLDLTSYRKMFKEKGYVRIENILEPAYAENIAATLKNDVKWDLCYLTGSNMTSVPQTEYSAYTQAQSAELNRAVLKKAQNEFSYFYYRSDLVRSQNEVLSAFYRGLITDESLGMFRYLTDEPLIRTVDGQLACFTPACFLKIHEDKAPKAHRFAAYVFSFTQGWVPDWGGHLHILDQQGRNIDVFEPSFNTLTLFKVPTVHFVSQVSNYALGARLTATGWMLY